MLPEFAQGLRGTFKENQPLSPYTTMKIGGPADYFFEPEDFDDLAQFLQQKPEDMPMMVMGKGSNMLVSDAGVEGVVVHIGKGCDTITVEGNRIYAESGVTSAKLARTARDHGLTGLEFLIGIPGSVGGALKMNAGAYGSETMPMINWVDVLTDQGVRVRQTPRKIGYSYRHSGLPETWLYVGAEFELEAGDPERIKETMANINKNRKEAQPVEMPCSGSWFKNVPCEDGSVKRAWQLVKAAQCGGLRVGDAMVSEKHNNFFVNMGNATATEMLELSAMVEEKVAATQGVILEREVRFVGRFTK